MPTLGELREGLKDTIVGTIPDLNGYQYVPDVQQVPAVVVEPDSADYQLGMGSCQAWIMCIYVLVARTDTRVGQEKLDTYLSSTGENSIPAALRAAPTLGLSGVDATLVRMDAYGGSFEGARITHIGARLYVKIIVTE